MCRPWCRARYPREVRDSLDELINLPVLTPSRAQITLGTVADVRITNGPPMLRSENGRPATWVYVDGRGRALTEIVGDLQRAIAEKVKLPPGISVAYTGQFEFLERATQRLKIVVPATLLIIFALLYATFRRWDEALLIMGTLPFAASGCFICWATISRWQPASDSLRWPGLPLSSAL